MIFIKLSYKLTIILTIRIENLNNFKVIQSCQSGSKSLLHCICAFKSPFFNRQTWVEQLSEAVTEGDMCVHFNYYQLYCLLGSVIKLI